MTEKPAGSPAPEVKDSMAHWISKLKQQRDELALQIHLAEMDARDEFDKAKDRLTELSAKYEPLKDAMSESAEGIWQSLKLVAGEIKESFDRVKKSL